MASRVMLVRKEPEVPVHNDSDILNAAARLAGEDLCSIGDLSSAEVRAILKLGHEVKRNDAAFIRHRPDFRLGHGRDPARNRLE